MKPNYNNLWKLLIEKGMTKTELRVKAEMSTSTLAKMGKNEVVSMNVIIKICEILDCNVSDVMTVDKISEQTSLYNLYNIQEERQQGKQLGELEKEERQVRQKCKNSLANFPNKKKARLRNRVFCLGDDSFFVSVRQQKERPTKSWSFSFVVGHPSEMNYPSNILYCVVDATPFHYVGLHFISPESVRGSHQ